MLIGRMLYESAILWLLRATLAELVETPEALPVGEDLMLLSSAKFELSSAGPEPVAIDVTERSAWI